MFIFIITFVLSFDIFFNVYFSIGILKSYLWVINLSSIFFYEFISNWFRSVHCCCCWVFDNQNIGRWSLKVEEFFPTKIEIHVIQKIIKNFNEKVIRVRRSWYFRAIFHNSQFSNEFHRVSKIDDYKSWYLHVTSEYLDETSLKIKMTFHSGNRYLYEVIFLKNSIYFDMRWAYGWNFINWYFEESIKVHLIFINRSITRI